MFVGYICALALTCLQIIKNTADCQYVVEQKKRDRLLPRPLVDGRIAMTRIVCVRQAADVMKQDHKMYGCVRCPITIVNRHGEEMKTTKPSKDCFLLPSVDGSSSQ